ncbi:hypothetical protein KM043_017012 [Ampulex compressa]|nr:hypothetical protein KM043_017012 [Ampulex compressa]
MFRSTFLTVILFWTAILYGMVNAAPALNSNNFNHSMSSLHEWQNHFKNALPLTKNLTHGNEFNLQQIIADLGKCVHAMHIIEASNKESSTSE